MYIFVSATTIMCTVWKKESCPYPCHEGMWWSGGTRSFSLNVGTSWRWVVSFTLWPLYFQGKKPLVPVEY